MLCTHVKSNGGGGRMVEQRKERDAVIVDEVIITGLLYFGELLANSTPIYRGCERRNVVRTGNTRSICTQFQISLLIN